MLYDIHDVNTVKPLEITPLGGDMAEDLRLFLNRAAKYAVKHWWSVLRLRKYSKDVYFPLKRCLDSQLINASNYSRHLATLIMLDAVDESVVTETKQAVQDKCIKLIRSLAHNHSANTVGGWSVSAVAASTAIAGFLIWHKLNDMDKLLLVNMLEGEANRIIGIKTPYRFIRESGADTGNKSRLTSEYINVLNIAITMMPRSAHADEWRAKFSELQAAAYSSESDGLKGWNTENDGLIVSGVVDVNCMNAIVYNFDAVTVAALAGVKLEGALIKNAMRVYDAFNNLYISRAGKAWEPLYGRNYNDEPLPALNLPKAHKDSPYKYANYFANDVLAYCYGYTGGNPKEWAQARMKKLLYMQSCHANYRIYSSNYIERRKERESSAAKMGAIAYLALYLKATNQLY